MKRLIALIILVFVTTSSMATPKISNYNPALQPYVAFLQQNLPNPVNYVMDLFSKYDVVVIAERDHRETTQWNFIYSLVSDPRFISEVGNIFVEYGSVTNQPAMDAFLNSPTLDTAQALNLMRNQPIWPEGRDNNNFYDFLLKFYPLNQTLTPQMKIEINQSDVPWQWDNMTEQFYHSYMEYEDSTGQLQMSPDSYSRDRRMALRIYMKYQDLLKNNATRKKILVIMNSRHARGEMKILDKYPYGFLGQNVAGCLMQWLPKDTVANVLLNDYTNDKEGNPAAYIDGKWDAAFAVVANKSVGFSLPFSPFGEDYFSEKMGIRFQDIFTGMIFYKPLSEQMLDNDIPNFYSEDFKKTVEKRALLIGTHYLQSIETMWQDRQQHPEKYGNRKLTTEPGFDNVLKQIDQWL